MVVIKVGDAEVELAVGKAVHDQGLRVQIKYSNVLLVMQVVQSLKQTTGELTDLRFSEIHMS